MIKDKERRIQGVHDDEHRKKTTTKGKETEKSRDYSKRKEELYDRRTIRGIPTPRPIKKSSLAQIF